MLPVIMMNLSCRAICPGCGEWNSYAEQPTAPRKKKGGAVPRRGARAVPVTEAAVRTIVEEETARLREELGEAAYTEGRFDEFMTAPVDATFIFDQETKEFTIVASQSAIVVDVEALAEAVETAALGIGRGRIPTMVGDEAAFTTEMAEAMGPITEVSTFTTFHPCCANRVINIQKLADEIDGAIVMQQKFCDPHELDTPAIRKALEAKGVRSIFLEFDVTVPVGQFQTRVEAFLEMIGEEDLFD